MVSIPAGFSDALRPYLYAFGDHPIVSIPAGFSDALRLQFDNTVADPIRSFNPCWVF